MQTRAKILIAAGAAVVLAGAAATVSVATGTDDQPLEGTELEQATAAALAYTGEGRVVESEAGEGGGAYEVGVLLDDGAMVEIQLDERFEVIGSEADEEGAGSEGNEQDDAGSS